jgi:hypothetical protein
MMTIFNRYGGLSLIRQVGENIVMRWEGCQDILLETLVVTDREATIRVRDVEFTLSIGQSIEVPGPSDDRPAMVVITLDDLAGERAALRLLAPKRVRIIRSEKLI